MLHIATPATRGIWGTPWTPIEVSQAKDGSLTVGCWNRKHLFESAPLPASIKNGAARILAAPVRIAAKVAGHEQKWTPGKLVITGKDKNKVVFKTTQTSASLSLAAETAMEFDFDDLGAEVAEHPRGMRAGPVVGEIEDAATRQRRRGRRIRTAASNQHQGEHRGHACGVAGHGSSQFGTVECETTVSLNCKAELG